jgi:predicted regulator of amino acid metabolism with ACT domain
LWNTIKKYFEGYPERLKVARVLVENGLSAKNHKIFMENREIRLIFEELRPAGHSLKEIAKHLSLGVVEITPVDAKMPGILGRSAMLLTTAGLSIRQAIVDDPELSPEPKLTLIVEKKIPGELISELLKINGVAKISVY